MAKILLKEKKPFFLFSSFRFKIMFFFVLTMVAAGTATNILVTNYALRSQFEQLRSKLESIAQTAAVSIDGSSLQSIPLNKEGAQTPVYKDVVRKLLEIKRKVPGIRYIYILAKTAKPGILQFVINDSTEEKESEAETAVAYPGDEYDATRFPEMLEGFVKASADKEMGADQWGVFLSGYAPVRSREGAVVAVLGVDMTAEDVRSVQTAVRQRMRFFFLLKILAAILLGFFISGGVTRQVRELMKGVQHFGKGDLDCKVAVKGRDELAQLACVFNKMSEDLKLHIEELKRTTAEKERLVREIEIAREIQRSFLPEFYPEIAGIDIAAMTLPARMVGGDFYDFIPIDKNIWGLAIADVSGKGIPSALFMALSRALMRASATITTSPDKAINHANNLICQDSKANMFVTLFYAVLDAETKTFKYANAGHNPPLLVSASSNDIVLLKAQTMPLGIAQDIEATTEEFTLKPGDLVILYTDGVTEAINEEREQFDVERLEKIVKDNRHLSADQLMHRIEDALKKFVGKQPQFDDITIMIIKAT
ncbi:MAG: SpoIIE family protein phosphatase [Candidatus Omnitrophica bacterium]|nr:SpoIIE family protein phosphatase [Candidatus Omnitrophota bacterium]